ncbi:MAG: hypothetical protein AAFP92_09125 [Bacteroidota bacterium]
MRGEKREKRGETVTLASSRDKAPGESGSRSLQLREAFQQMLSNLLSGR